MAGELLRIRSIGKTFPGQVALDGASLTVAAGEVHALVGQNGSGKSTLIKLLAGYHRPDPGADIEFRGRPLDLGGHQHAAAAAGLRFVHQDLALVPNLDAVDNLALASGFRTGPLGRIDRREEQARLSDRMEALGIDVDVARPVGELTRVEQTTLAIARALDGWESVQEGGLLVLDEPTAALPAPEVAALFDAVRRVAAAGAGVLFVSHRLNEIFEIADRVTVLRDGRTVAVREVAGLATDELVQLIAGAAADAPSVRPAGSSSGGAEVEIAGLAGRRLRELSLTLAAGELVGVYGLLGSGREDVADLVFGAAPARAGRLRIGSAVRDYPIDPATAIALGLALVPADRLARAILPAGSVRENLSLPRLRALRRWGRVDTARERAESAGSVADLGVAPPEVERPVGKLSGGNQQKVVIGRWLATDPTLLLLDEPTQGVDVGAKAAIHRLLAEAAAGGTAGLVCSSDPDELVALCDRVLVLRDGLVAASLEGSRLSSGAILRGSLGGRPAGRRAEAESA